MDAGASNNPKSGPDSQDAGDTQPGAGPSGTGKQVIKFVTKNEKLSKNVSLTSKGVEKAKKTLRAFSIQKKSSLSPVSVPKPITTGHTTVFIGRATGVKTTIKPEPDPAADPKKPPKPPKPGAKQPQDSYILTQKRTLAEIEDMKRKMELVELGIPLGLICPAPNSDKAMPTKAMPPIKTLLDLEKVDEVIREAKKARAEGKEFKFDYRKLLPDYDNPFQRKRDGQESMTEFSKSLDYERKSRDRDKKRSDKKYILKRQPYKSDDKDRYREDKYKEKSKERDQSSRDREKSKDTPTKSKERDSKFNESNSKSKEKYEKPKELYDKDEKSKIKKDEVKKVSGKDEKETEVNLKDFVVCDSWSDNEEKSKDSTPKTEERINTNRILKEKAPILYPMETDPAIVDPMTLLRQSLQKKKKKVDSAKPAKPRMERLNPVIDSFSYEINEDDDEMLDMFEENSTLEKFSKVVPKKEPEELSIDMQIFDYDAKDDTFEGMADDTFLESVINEIKQEEIDETSQDKGLVEYDESPSKDSRDSEIRGSVTPEIDDERRRLHSSRSDYSDGYKSTESGYKSTDSKSAYKSDTELERIVEEKKRELERMVDDRKINKYTQYSMETWSFVLKICQPLLFRHDRNKCYKETQVVPKLWYTENPKLCNCVKDRGVVYSELEMCKMELVDSLYNTKQPPEPVPMTSRAWYGRARSWLREAARGASSEWEVEDSQADHPPANADISLDKEYRRFMQAVWPEVAEAKSETPRSSPVRREPTKKKADELPDSGKQTMKKMKLSSEGWSQESEMEEETDKSYNALQDFLYEALHYNPSPDTVTKKVKPEKEKRKRKHSTSSSISDSSESETKKRKKSHKKKDIKKTKSKDSKRRRVSKKNVKKLKEKQKKKKKKVTEIEEDSDAQDLEREKKKKEKRLRKKKLQKQKKKNQKKKKAKAKSSSSSDSSSDSESDEKRSKKKKKNSDKKKKRKESTESREELFDVNILNNIKTEKDTDDEISKRLEFSPRRQKPREIINVKELQNDFVGNSIQIKKEVEEDERRKEEHSASAEMAEKQKEDSLESRAESVATQKDTQSDFKEEEESQSTPQMRPDEANNSQCSSQESIYSSKNETPYEKDISHLRPSSQNSNYSFHDVMASGMYSKNKQMAEDKHNQNSLEIQRQERDNQSQDHDMHSYDQDIYTHEHEIQNKHMRSHVQDIHSREHDMRSHDQDIHSREHDMRSHDQDIHSREHDLRSLDQNIHSHEHNMRSHDQDIQSHGHDMRSHDQDIHSHEHDMRSHDQDIQSHGHDMRSHDMQTHDYGMQGHDHDMDTQEYEQGNYEMYEQMAMAYQSDVASQRTSPPDDGGSRRIETVVRGRTCGEIKCDWRAGDSGAPPQTPTRPSRWGLKPGEVNIVLTGGEQEPIPIVAEPVYKIQSLANRSDTSGTGYDEAYANMFGAADKLQYGDCFSTEHPPESRTITPATSSLDARINLALKTSVLGEVAKVSEETEDKDVPDKGILVTKSLNVENRASKRVRFADGYQPGQDSDVEEPPVKKRKKARRVGCAWPCPAEHADHVALWDALPPPPPPAGSPPPPAGSPPPPAAAPPPPPRLLRRARPGPPLLPTPPQHAHKFDPNSMAAFMPPEPSPGIISFQNM